MASLGILADRHAPGAPRQRPRRSTSSLAPHAPFVLGHSHAQLSRLPWNQRRAFNTADGSPTLARRPPAPSPPGQPVPVVVSALHLIHGLDLRATSGIAER